MTHYLQNHAHFKDKFELDRAATEHKQEHWQAMNQTDRDVLDIIRRYSVKFGAAHLKHDTIAHILGKSNVTARRAIRKLVALGIIERIPYLRPVMKGLGANIYAIKPFQQPEKIVQPKIEKPLVTKEKMVDTEIQAPVPTTVFERMKAMLAATLGETSMARRFFGVYRQQVLPMLKFSIYEHEQTLFEQLSIQALHIAVQATKKRKIYNLPGYYSGILRELIDHALFNDVLEEYDTSIEFFMAESNT